MSAVELTIKALKASAGVTATVGTNPARIFPLVLPLGTQLPAISVAMQSEDDDYHLGGANQYPVSSVRIHCTAATAKAAVELGEAVKAALQDHHGTYGGVHVSFRKQGTDFTDFAEDFSTHRRMMSFAVRWR